METVRTEVDSVIEEKKRQLENSIEARHILCKLPDSILDFPADSIYTGIEHLTFQFWGKDRNSKARELLSLLVEHGAIMKEENLKERTFSWKPTDMYMEGKLGNISITVKGLALPPTCEVGEIDNPTPGKLYKVKCTGKGSTA